jgi:hypothetical protein
MLQYLAQSIFLSNTNDLNLVENILTYEVEET